MAEEKVRTAAEDMLYVSSVPVTLLYSGATFMYRLFDGMENRLIIFQGIKLNEESQLKNTSYNYYPPVFQRLQFTRFKKLHFFLNLGVNYFFIPAKLRRLIKQQKPKVIITVSHGLLWILAYRVARKNNLPLVMIVHDDLNSYHPKEKFSGKIMDRLFRKIYTASHIRFCISGLMKERYDEKYGVPAEVLYPLQGKQELFHATETHQLTRGLTIAYAGSLDSGPFVNMIITLARELEKVHGSLIIFTNAFPTQLEAIKNIVNHGFLLPDKLNQKMEELADVLFVPFPFYDNDVSVELAFPSKMTDYTLVRKPLLIWAPPKSAISRWVNSLQLRIGVLVQTMDIKDISQAINQLSDPSNNKTWGENSYTTGQEYFNHEKQQQFFFSKVGEVMGQKITA